MGRYIQLSYFLVMLLVLVSFVHSFEGLIARGDADIPERLNDNQQVVNVGKESDDTPLNSDNSDMGLLPLEFIPKTSLAAVNERPMYVRFSLRSSSNSDDNLTPRLRAVSFIRRHFTEDAPAAPLSHTFLDRKVLSSLTPASRFQRLLGRMSAVMNAMMSAAGSPKVTSSWEKAPSANSAPMIESGSLDDAVSLSSRSAVRREEGWSDSADKPQPPRHRHGHRHGHTKDSSADRIRGYGDGGFHRFMSCAKDVKRFCLAVASAEDGMQQAMPLVMACLAQHEAQLSPKCSAKISSMAAFQCAADALRLCPMQASIQPWVGSNAKQLSEFWRRSMHSIFMCLEGQPEQLSDQCLNAVNERLRRRSQAESIVVHPSKVSIPSTDEDLLHEDNQEQLDPQVIALRAEDEEAGDIAHTNFDASVASAHSPPSAPSSGAVSFPQWALIALLAISSSLVFMAALTVLLLLLHKHRRQRQAVLEAANSLHITLPSTLPCPHAIPITEHDTYQRLEDQTV